MSEPKQKRGKSSIISLGERFSALREKHLGEVCVTASSISSVEDVRRVRKMMDEVGFVFITSAVSQQSVKEAKSSLCDAMWKMFRFNLPARTLQPKSLKEWNGLRNSKTGFGNPSFSYINKQFTKKESTPFFDIGREKVYVTTNSIFSEVTLPMLLHPDNLHATAILLGLTHVNGMVSVDSVKFASNPKPKPV